MYYSYGVRKMKYRHEGLKYAKNCDHFFEGSKLSLKIKKVVNYFHKKFHLRCLTWF